MRNEILQKIQAGYAGTKSNVEHNVLVPGKSGYFHRIDIVISYEFLRLRNILVECKQHTRPISVGLVRNFFGSTHDTNSSGMMFTTTGYQPGAKTFANHYGIELVCLKEIKK
ncbi:restriction endonuclease [Nitrospirillum bahiense]|uniref:restriction endonuclease n=1 Tax=Nitrospirillum amazonense TaxID=28077 RepID=UPI003CCC718C